MAVIVYILPVCATIMKDPRVVVRQAVVLLIVLRQFLEDVRAIVEERLLVDIEVVKADAWVRFT